MRRQPAGRWSAAVCEGADDVDAAHDLLLDPF
jgi:hypothetical protein